MELPIDYSKASWQERREARLQYVAEQNNLCYHCKGELDRPPPEFIKNTSIRLVLFPHGFLDSLVHLHHCHRTDKTLGAVHARCNAILWQYYGV